MGRVLIDAGRPAEAVEQLERSLELRLEHPENRWGMAETKYRLARALWDAGEDRARARAFARDALDDNLGEDEWAVKQRAVIGRWLDEHKGTAPGDRGQLLVGRGAARR